MLSARETSEVTGERGAMPGASWSSIFAGVVIALGVILLMMLLGMAVGFTVVDPMHDADPLAGVPLGAGIYTVFVHLLALGLGGYAATRLAGSAWTSRALLHGASVWAVVSLFIVVMAATGVGALITGMATAVQTITGGTAQVVQDVVPEDMELPEFRDVSTLIPDDFIEDLPPDVQQSLQEQDIGTNELRQAGGEALDQVITEQAQQQAQQALTDTLANIARNPGEADAYIQQFAQGLVGPDGLISEQERQQAAAVFQARLDIQEDQAQALIENWQQQLEQRVGDLEGDLQAVQTEAMEAAQQATDVIARASWFAFLVSLLGLLAALLGAWLGRPSILAVDRI